MADSKVKLKVQQITNFNSGEYSPQMSGRVDLESFGSSARKLSNFLVTVPGGLKKFYGTAHVAEIDKPEHIKLVSFVNRFEPMALVLHDGHVGLIRNGEYAELNIGIPVVKDYDMLRWKQLNDRILFVHPSVQPFAIDFYGLNDEGDGYKFVSSSIEFEEIPYFPIGFTGDYTGTLEVSGTSGTITATIPGDGLTALLPFPKPLDTTSSLIRIDESFINGSATYTAIQAGTVELVRVREEETVIASGSASSVSIGTYDRLISTGLNRPGASAGATTTVTVRQIKEVVSRELVLQAIKEVFPKSSIEGGFLKITTDVTDTIQSGDKLYLRISLNEYTRTNNGEAEPAVHVPAESFDTSSSQESVVSNEFPDTNLVGRKIKFYTNTNGTTIPWVAESTVQTNDVRYSNGSWYSAVEGGTCGKTQPSHLTGQASDGSVVWQYLHSGSASASILSVNGRELKIQLPDGVFMPVLKLSERTFNNFAWSIWGHKGTHPSDIYFVQNRLGIVCNTESFGAWNAMSVSDKYLDFSTEQYGQQLDTSAIVHLIMDNPDNKINWVLSYNTLYMGSYTNEFSITASGRVFTPTTLVVNPVSSLGGAPVVPMKYKELNLFVGSKKDEVYTIGYDYTIEDYVPKSIGYITNHLLSQKISRLVSVNNKDQNVYILHETGTISVLNYVGDQGVLGYSPIDAGAPVYDMCSTSSGQTIRTYMAVGRNEGKVSFEYITDTEPTYMWNTFFYSGDPVSGFAIPELANKNVFVVVDGQFIEHELDENGQYEFDEPVSEYSVGIKLVAELHTQPAFGKKVEGLPQANTKVALRLVDSGAFFYGNSTDFNKYYPFSNWGTEQVLGEPHDLYTGDALLDISSGYASSVNTGQSKYPNDTGIGINIKSETPEPFNLLLISEVYV